MQNQISPTTLPAHAPLTVSLVQREAMQRALVSLEAHCDGAEQRDGQGFSKSDVGLGTYFAGRPTETWTAEEAAFVAHTCHHYRRQLEAYGIDLSTLPDLSDEQRQAVREAARTARQDAERRAQDEAAAARREAEEARQGLFRAGERLSLRMPYNASRTDAARLIPGRIWTGECDVWPAMRLHAVLGLCEQYGVPVRLTQQDVADLEAVAARETALREAAAREAAARAQVTLEGRRIAFRFEFDAKKKDIVKSAGAKWDSDGRYWYMTAAQMPAALTAAEKANLRVDPALREAATAAKQAEQEAQVRAGKQRVAALAARDSLEPLTISGITTPLMPHQSAPVQMLGVTRRLLIADAPGLGKTLTSIAAVHHLNRERTVIVCPSSLTGNWVREFAQHTDGSKRVHVLEGTKAEAVPAGTDVVVLGWAVLSARLDDLKAWKPDALVVDEAHYAKTGKGSARAEAALTLSSTVRAAEGMVLLLTGTPIVNRPLELLALLRMLGAEGSFGGTKGFLDRYCGPRWQVIRGGKEQQVFDGASNTQELHQKLLDSGLYIRRTKADLVRAGQMGNKIINGLTALDLTTKRAPAGLRLTEQELAPYRTAVKEFEAWLEVTLGTKGLSRAEINRRVAAAADAVLPRIGALRQVVAQVKLPHVIRQAQELVDAGEQVVIVAHHREIVDALEAQLGAVKIQGGMSVKKVEEAKRQFNARESMVMVLSMEAGKTGHTLCLQRINGAGPECAHMLIAEESWAPGDEEQAQDRLWRIGQTRDVQVTNLTLMATLDQGIWDLREQKRGVVSAVTDGTELDEEKIQVTSFLTNYIMMERN